MNNKHNPIEKLIRKPIAVEYRRIRKVLREAEKLPVGLKKGGNYVQCCYLCKGFGFITNN